MPGVWNTIEACEPTVVVPSIPPGSDEETEFVKNILGDDIIYASPREKGYYVNQEVKVQQFLRATEELQVTTLKYLSQGVY